MGIYTQPSMPSVSKTNLMLRQQHLQVGFGLVCFFRALALPINSLQEIECAWHEANEVFCCHLLLERVLPERAYSKQDSTGRRMTCVQTHRKDLLP